MTRHSKSNQTVPAFTYRERQMVRDGTQSMRISSDSMRDFDSCFLCLSKARDPMSCDSGHICCKECIFEFIIKKKKELQNVKKAEEDKLQLKEIEKVAIEQQVKLKEAEEFVKKANSVVLTTTSRGTSEKPGSSKTVTGVETSKTGSNFWVPSVAAVPDTTMAEDLSGGTSTQVPSSKQTGVECPFSEAGKEHFLNVKRLVQVKFTTQQKEKVCPSCRKTLTNSSKLVILRKCGHVLCKTCSDFCKAKECCMVCSEKLKKKDLIPLEAEGTGFASRGNTEIKKYQTAFKM
jgi:nitric oxide synthase-interacting protein